MEQKETISKIFRILLGLFLIVYALNQFFHFIPAGYGQMPDNSRDFLDAVVIYLPYLYIFEALIGLLLILNKWTKFILIVLFPLSIAFLIFNFTNNDMTRIFPALVVAFLNVFLLFKNKEAYKPLFA